MLNIKNCKINYCVIALLIIILIVQIHNCFASYILNILTWRQGDVASVARNFAHESANIFLPRIDSRGQYSGITGMEFPLYNYIVSLFYRISGHIWLGFGKLLSLTFSLCALLYLYKLLQLSTLFKKHNSAPLFLIIAYVMPFYQFYSLLLMPEMMVLFLCCYYLYHLFTYQKTQQAYHLKVASIALSIGILCRPYYVMFILPLIFLDINSCKKKYYRTFYRILLCAAILLPAFLWYQIWCPYLIKHYHITYFYRGKIDFNNLISLNAWGDMLSASISAICSFPFVPFILLGLLMTLKKRVLLTDPAIQLFIITISTWLFLLIAAGFHTHGTWFGHDYYLGPLYPACICFALFGILTIMQWIPCKLIHNLIYIALGLLFLQIAFLQSWHWAQKEDPFITTFLQNKATLQVHIPTKALVLYDSENRLYPYLFNRKGWCVSFHGLTRKQIHQHLITYKKLGAHYFVRYTEHGYQITQLSQ